jgi:putative SOS response-associated peptidase YedK
VLKAPNTKSGLGESFRPVWIDSAKNVSNCGVAGSDRGPGRKQPYAIAMKDGSPFGLAGLWENWRNPNTDEWERTFAVITVPSNELVGQIHDRMPAILKPERYDRWLGLEPDPHDLLITYPSEPMTMWPISTRVNKPENDDASILDRAAEPMDWQAPRWERSPIWMRNPKDERLVSQARLTWCGRGPD